MDIYFGIQLILLYCFIDTFAYLNIYIFTMDNYFGILCHSYIKHWPLLFLQQAYGGHSVCLGELLAVQHKLFCIALILVIVVDSLFASHLHDIKCA